MRKSLYLPSNFDISLGTALKKLSLKIPTTTTTKNNKKNPNNVKTRGKR